MGKSPEQRVRLWNGYIGYKLLPDIRDWLESQRGESRLVIDPPEGGWPELTDQEKESIEALASSHGYPKFDSNYMDFSDHIFLDNIDFSGLILVHSNFRGARFLHRALFKKARFDTTGDFSNTQFDKGADFDQAHFKAQAFFGGVQFKGPTNFTRTKFICGASFGHAYFEFAWFDYAQFSERGFPLNMSPEILVDFTNAKFTSPVSFPQATFGSVDCDYSRTVWPERVADFSGATFEARTSYYKAVFGGVPAFFNAKLHEDTDFGGVHWDQVGADRVRPNYAVRAWERLELIMSQLEKPLDRYQFFRFKVRARRRMDGWFLWILNRLYEITSGYGWGVERAFLSWLGHWTGFAIILFVNTGCAMFTNEWWKLALAALGTGFANAHAFLGLATAGGYLEEGRKLLEKNNEWGLLTGVGLAEAVLGPTFLFLLLLTLRNRFRLA